MALLLVALFIVVPIAEIYVIIKVGELIGIWPTIFLLLADALIGSWLLRHQGRGAWRRFNEAIGQRRLPGKEVADGALIIVGGTLLVTPGFLSDIVGIVLLVPPTRALVRRVLGRFMVGRFAFVTVANSFPRGGTGGPGGPRSAGGANRPYDFDGTAEEMSPNGNGTDRELPRIEEE
ncbi:MAG: FxsA family protein [Solirubrobacterales bacterium]